MEEIALALLNGINKNEEPELDYSKYDPEQINKFKECMENKLNFMRQKSSIYHLDTVKFFKDFKLETRWSNILDQLKMNIFNSVFEYKGVYSFTILDDLDIDLHLDSGKWIVNFIEQSKYEPYKRIYSKVKEIFRENMPPYNIFVTFLQKIHNILGPNYGYYNPTKDDPIKDETNYYFIKNGRWHPIISHYFRIDPANCVVEDAWLPVLEYPLLIGWDLIKFGMDLCHEISRFESERLYKELDRRHIFEFIGDMKIVSVALEINQRLTSDQNLSIETAVNESRFGIILTIYDLLHSLLIAPITLLILRYHIDSLNDNYVTYSEILY